MQYRYWKVSQDAFHCWLWLTCMYDWQEEPPAEEPEDTYEDTTPQDNYEDVTPPAPSSGTGGKTAVAIYDYQAG